MKKTLTSEIVELCRQRGIDIDPNAHFADTPAERAKLEAARLLQPFIAAFVERAMRERAHPPTSIVPDALRADPGSPGEPMTRRPYEPPAIVSLSPALLVEMFTTAKTQPGLTVEGHLWLSVGTCPGCRRTVQHGATLRVHGGMAYHPACAPAVVLAGAR